VRLTVRGFGEPWSVTARTCLTRELNGLLPWLRLVAAQPAERLLHWHAVVNPSLAFDAQRVKGRLQLRARLNYLYLPPDRFDGVYHMDADTVLDFFPSEAELRRFADELEQELRRFPVREPPPDYVGPP
jgi:hypothetical protein